MIDIVLKEKILNQLENLSYEKQQLILDLSRSLSNDITEGVAGKDLLKFSGTITKQDLKEMEKAIEEKCEKVDVNGW